MKKNLVLALELAKRPERWAWIAAAELGELDCASCRPGSYIGAMVYAACPLRGADHCPRRQRVGESKPIDFYELAAALLNCRRQCATDSTLCGLYGTKYCPYKAGSGGEKP